MTNRISTFLYIFLVTFSLSAQTKPLVETKKEKDHRSDTPLEQTREIVEETTEKVESAVQNTRQTRTNNSYYGLITYSPVDLIIPSKLGITVGFNKTADTTWELEYLRGSVSPFFIDDLGKMIDQKISILARSYLGTNSFYIGWGISYMTFKTRLGSEYLSTATGTQAHLDLLKQSSLGFNLSVGNRWVINKNFVLGIDWIGWSQPLFQLKREDAFLDNSSDPELKKNVDDALDLLAYFPRLSLFKLQLGLSF
jgi:hypothetical protein